MILLVYLFEAHSTKVLSLARPRTVGAGRNWEPWRLQLRTRVAITDKAPKLSRAMLPERVLNRNSPKLPR